MSWHVLNELMRTLVPPDKKAFLQSVGGKKIIIYGAGNTGKDVLGALKDEGAEVFCFLDRSAVNGDIRWGIPVYRPDDPVIPPGDRADAMVIIGVFNRSSSLCEIEGGLRALGYGRSMSFAEFYEFHQGLPGGRFWLWPRTNYSGYKKEIEEAYSLWADEKSRSLYEKIIECRLAGKLSALPAPSGRQYFPEDIPQWRTPLRFVDCGAFDGDTLSEILESKIPIQAYAGFEPDPENFRKLSALARASRYKLDSALWPCGVWSGSQIMRFNPEGESGCISDTGSRVIQCVSLDEALPSFSPNLVKMDIEGAEYEALLGAKKLITRERPGLAICLYHRPEHIFSLAVLINNWDCGYSFYLRSHGWSGFDLVMYAVPDAG